MNGLPKWMVEAGAELSTGFGDEFRAEAEAGERAAAKLRLRNRSLSDVFVEAMHRGTRVSVLLGGAYVSGQIIHSSADLATLKTASGARLHVNLGSKVVLSCESGRWRAGRGRDQFEPDSFKAMLRSVELTHRPVRIELDGTDRDIRGTIEAVADDHLMIPCRDVEWYVPVTAVFAIWP